MRYFNIIVASVLWVMSMSGMPANARSVTSKTQSTARFSRIFSFPGQANGAKGILRGANGEGYLVYGSADVLRLNENARTIYWQQAYGTTNPAARNGFLITKIVSTRDGMYLMLRQNYLIPDSGSTYQSYPHIAKIGETGYTAWNTRFAMRPFNVLLTHSIAESAPGVIIAAGQGSGGSSPFGTSWIQRIDSTGLISWTKSVNTRGLSYFFATNNGTYQLTSSEVFGSTPPTYEYQVKKTDSSGSIIWAKSITVGGDRIYRFEELIALADGDLLVRAESERGDGRSHQTLLLRLSPDGALRWHRIFKMPLVLTANSWQARSATGLVESANGHIVLSGNTVEYSGTFAIPAGIASRSPWLAQFDADGAKRWSMAYTSTVSDASIAFSGIVTQTDGYVIAGVHKTAADYEKMWLLGVDEAGTPGAQCASSATADFTEITDSLSITNTTTQVQDTSIQPFTSYSELGAPITNTLEFECNDSPAPPGTHTLRICLPLITR